MAGILDGLERLVDFFISGGMKSVAVLFSSKFRLVVVLVAGRLKSIAVLVVGKVKSVVILFANGVKPVAVLSLFMIDDVGEWHSVAGFQWKAFCDFAQESCLFECPN